MTVTFAPALLIFLLQNMLLNNLNPNQYKRFFAFGCSFTNYCWPTWADIIAQDIPFYENWGARGSGNEFIFNSVIEADTRHKFNQDDLVMIMWSSTSREDRYSNNKWLHATIDIQAERYSKEWFKKFSADTRAHLIHDYAYIKSTQCFLNSTGCDWSNLVMHPIAKTKYLPELAKKLNVTTEIQEREFWYNAWDRLRAGDIDQELLDLFEDQDVIDVYREIFKNIQASYECLKTFKERDYLSTPKTDHRINPHPTPLQALAFLDIVWPDNTLSVNAREYAATWDKAIYTNTDWSKPIHRDQTIVRL